MNCKLHSVAGLALLSLTAAWGAQDPLTIANGNLTVTLDPNFPRIIRYVHKKDGAVIDGQVSPTSKALLNGVDAACQATFMKTGPDGGDYTINFPGQQVSIRLHVGVEVDSVDLRITAVGEGATKLHTLAFPDDALLTIRTSQPGAAFTRSAK